MDFWRRRKLNFLVFDFGSKNIKVMFKGKLLLAEPTLVAKNAQTEEVLAIGHQTAKFALNSQIAIIEPISNGRVSHQREFVDLMEFLAKSLKIQGLPIPKKAIWASILGVGLTAVEREQFREAWQLGGGKKERLISQESALAAYAYKKYHAANINLVDVGQQSTRIVIIEDQKTVLSQVLPWGVVQLEEAIEKFLIQKNIIIGVRATQKIVEELASFDPAAKKQLVLPVRMGLDQQSRNLRISSKQIFQATAQAVVLLGSLLEDFITLLSSPLQEAMQHNGLVLVGGGANLDYLDSYLTNRLRILVKKGEDATYANVLGLEEILSLK